MCREWETLEHSGLDRTFFKKKKKSNPTSQGSELHVEEKAEVLNDSRDISSSQHNRTDTYMNTQEV